MDQANNIKSGPQFPPVNNGWRRARACDPAAGNCVEVKNVGRAFAVRNSDNTDTPILIFSRQHWHDFIAGVKADEFNE